MWFWGGPELIDYRFTNKVSGFPDGQAPQYQEWIDDFAVDSHGKIRNTGRVKGTQIAIKIFTTLGNDRITLALPTLFANSQAVLTSRPLVCQI